MYGYGYGYYGFDWTYILLIIGMLAVTCCIRKAEEYFFLLQENTECFRAYRCRNSKKNPAGSRYHRCACTCNFRKSDGPLYDPRTKTVSLSEDIYGQTSLAAVGVAAHECGHAIQHAIGYAPLEFRSAIVPVANFGSTLSWPLFLIGLFSGIRPLVTAGIVLFSLAVLFQLVTLPVEINASSRALKMLQSTGILGTDETRGARKVLTAAAMTYVAALAASILQLLRLLILAGGRRRDD